MINETNKNFEDFDLEIFLYKAKQSIYSSVVFFLIIINLKIIIKEFLDLIDLIKAQTFHIYKLTKFVIVYKNKKLVFVVF